MYQQVPDFIKRRGADTRPQLQILGHAMPTPAAVHPRDYDTALYEELAGTKKKPKGLYPE